MNDPLDLSHHFSATAKRREASDVKKFYKYFAIPGIRNMAGGMPNASLFPFDTLEAQVVSPSASANSARLIVPHDSKTVDPAKKIDITTALQYGTAEGYPPLHAFIREFAREQLHPNVPYAGGPETILTCGATDGFSKVVELVTGVWDADRGDALEDRQGLLCEEYTYMNAIQTARPRGVNIAPVSVDEYGMKVYGFGGLIDVLEKWDTSSNRLSGLHDGHSNDIKPQKKHQEQSPGFLDTLMPSYLSIDVDGRVIRLDTFSKTVAPGCRLGWITAQPAVIERLARITEVSTAQPSGFVQAMVAKMIIQEEKPSLLQVLTKKNVKSSWGMSGWIDWLEKLRDAYERRMQTMCRILGEGSNMLNEDDDASTEDSSWSTVSKTKIYNFKYPGGGMFVWLHMRTETHPLYCKVDEDRLMKAFWLFLTQAPYLAIVAPGAMFNPLQHSDQYQYPPVTGNQTNR
ncbi:hypothetical protein KEM56_007672, partial [Ascosphaera pollenicola]